VEANLKNQLQVTQEYFTAKYDVDVEIFE